MKGTEAGVLVDAFDFSRMVSQVEFNIEVPEAERTHLDSLAQEFLPLLPKASLSLNGYYDNAAGYAYEKEMADRFGGADTLATLLLQRSVAACPTYVFPNCSVLEMTFGAPVAGLITLNLRIPPTGEFWRGLRVFAGDLDATGEQVTVDFGAGTANGGQAALHVTAIDGTAVDAEIRIESSANQVDWADEGSFIFSAVGGYTVGLVGVVGRYVRVNLLDLGGADEVSAVVVVGLNP